MSVTSAAPPMPWHWLPQSAPRLSSADQPGCVPVLSINGITELPLAPCELASPTCAIVSQTQVSRCSLFLLPHPPLPAHLPYLTYAVHAAAYVFRQVKPSETHCAAALTLCSEVFSGDKPVGCSTPLGLQLPPT